MAGRRDHLMPFRKNEDRERTSRLVKPRRSATTPWLRSVGKRERRRSLALPGPRGERVPALPRGVWPEGGPAGDGPAALTRLTCTGAMRGSGSGGDSMRSAQALAMAATKKLAARVPNSSKFVGKAPVAATKSIRGVPCPGLAETPPLTARAEMPTPGRVLRRVDQLGHGAGVLGLARDEDAGVSDLAVYCS